VCLPSDPPIGNQARPESALFFKEIFSLVPGWCQPCSILTGLAARWRPVSAARSQQPSGGAEKAPKRPHVARWVDGWGAESPDNNSKAKSKRAA